MAKNNKAGYRLAHGSGPDEKWLTRNQRRFFNSDHNRFSNSVQCKYCGSDYMRFSVEGYCQRCQQRAEYVLREHPFTAERAKPRGTYR